MNIGADGLWYFRSEVPGNETSAGWGADGFPHIHYDLLCRECEAGDVLDEGNKDWYRFKNKFYAGEVCATQSWIVSCEQLINPYKIDEIK